MNPEAIVFAPSERTNEAPRIEFDCNTRLVECERYICSLQGQIQLLRELAGLPAIAFAHSYSSYAYVRPVVYDVAQPTVSASMCVNSPRPREGCGTAFGDGLSARTDRSPSANSGLDRPYGPPSSPQQTPSADSVTRQRAAEVQCGPKIALQKTVSVQCDTAGDASVCACTQTPAMRAPASADVGLQCAASPKASRCTSVQCDPLMVVTDDHNVVRRVLYGWKATLARHALSMVDENRVRKLVGASTFRKSRVATNLFQAWFGIVLRGKQRARRVSIALARWRGVCLQEMATKLRERESNLYDLEDDRHMTIEQNKDLVLTVDSLRFELKEQEGRLANTRASCTDLLKRLRVAGDCVKAMQKGFVIHCNMCRKVMLRMTGDETGDSVCSIQATEECDNQEENEKILDFAHTHLTHATMTNLIPLREV
ncbi:hypothetical protein CYMTET_3862 [Cymbomonas tetramitiformis]|uniref:Uncharacterized protein n=1 Tax=Cymbomonas tetramitiformis TaxID=36881 RepID=A0AAE0LI80_9CHLO|nr:hypothetical protein CYMTET_6685 [Cymbomonas tetramitiformis]KAK3288644.1 hypothetical protein CYMTET_3862 [Cymbomonas tetramitiformis]